LDSDILKPLISDGGRQIPMRRRDHAHVHLPRRERPDALDLLMLQSAQILLGRHGWPGNVRELET